MALAIETICTAIAGMTVSGVTVYDIDTFPNEVKDRDDAVLMPKPDGFVTNFVITRDSFGGLKTVDYDLHYMLYFGAVGQGRGLAEKWSQMAVKLFAVLDAIIANDALTGTIEFTPQDVINIGPVVDPSGHVLHGAEIICSVKEFIG